MQQTGFMEHTKFNMILLRLGKTKPIFFFMEIQVGMQVRDNLSVGAILV
jgi:hypothetical protein